jgi:hypothetical protein
LSKDTFQYDNNNNLILHEDYFLGRLGNRETYNYDVNGNKLEYKKYKSDGTVEYIETFKYDVKGNLIEENKNGYKDTYKYNDKGLLVENCGYGKDGELGSHMNYKYDQFDDTGNWIKKRGTGYIISWRNSNGEYVPMISTTFFEREIKYY